MNGYGFAPMVLVGQAAPDQTSLTQQEIQLLEQQNALLRQQLVTPQRPMHPRPRPAPPSPPPPAPAPPPPPPQHHGSDIDKTLGTIEHVAKVAAPIAAMALAGDAPTAASTQPAPDGGLPATLFTVHSVWKSLSEVLREVSLSMRATTPKPIPRDKLQFLAVVDRLAAVTTALAVSPDDPTLQREFRDLSAFLATHPGSSDLASYIETHPQLAETIANATAPAAATGFDPSAGPIANPLWLILSDAFRELSASYRGGNKSLTADDKNFLEIIDRLSNVTGMLAKDANNPKYIAEFNGLSAFLLTDPDAPKVAAFLGAHPALQPVIATMNAPPTPPPPPPPALPPNAIPAPTAAAGWVGMHPYEAYYPPLFVSAGVDLGSLGNAVPALDSLLHGTLSAHVGGAMTGWNGTHPYDWHYPPFYGMAVGGADAMRAMAQNFIMNIQGSAMASEPIATTTMKQLSILANPASTSAQQQAAIAALRAFGPGISGLADDLWAALRAP